ncbi:MAG: hypothetical protein JXB42_13180 [Deltaproteobacteria bacterium]|nr:hypothetical protein [Deltaproteobacteria bacterium]
MNADVQIGEITSVSGNMVNITLISGSTKTVDLSNVRMITKETARALDDISDGMDVMVRGNPDQSGKIAAFAIVILPVGRDQKPPAGRVGGPFFGWVTGVSPLRINTESGDYEVSTGEQTAVTAEQQLRLSDIKPGDKVRLIGPPERTIKLIVLDALKGGRKDNLMARPGNLPNDDNGPIVKKEIPIPPSPRVNYFKKQIMDMTNDSAFGIKDAYMYRMDLMSWYDDYSATMNDLGIYWMEPAGPFGLSWNEVQRKRADGSLAQFDWTRYDSLVKNAQARNIHISFIIHATEPIPGPMSGYITPSLPKNIEAFKAFVHAAVERYDGDGENDMPGILYPIKYWKIEDEAMVRRYFNGSASDYAKVVVATYDAIKSADRNATVILSMVRGYEFAPDPYLFMDEFFREISKSGNVPKWDIIDHHWMVDAPKVPQKIQYREIKRYLSDIKTYAEKYKLRMTPFWTMEVAGIYTPERMHAIDLVKRFVYPFSLGVRKVFWSGLIEKPAGNLVGREIDPFEKVPLIDSSGTRKLAYYSLRNLVSALDGFDSSKTVTLKDTNDTYIFKFTCKNLPVWVMWYDGKGSVKERINIPSGVQGLIVTEAILPFESGQSVKGSNPLFKKSIVRVTGGSAEIEIGDVPLIVTTK